MLRIPRIKSSVSLIWEGIVGVLLKANVHYFWHPLSGRTTSRNNCSAWYTIFMYIGNKAETSRLGDSTNGKLSNIISNNSLDVKLNCKMLNVFHYDVSGSGMCPYKYRSITKLAVSFFNVALKFHHNISTSFVCFTDQ